MTVLIPGLTGELNTIVTEDMTAQHMGSGSMPVLATPSMIALMEAAALAAVAPYLGPGQTTVGVAVNVRHLAATPLGMEVRVTAELVAVDGRRLAFKVEAFDAVEKVGEGTHERMVIDLARFEGRLKRKTEGAVR